MDKHSPRRLIRIRLNPELHQLVRLHAASRGVSQAEIIRRSIRRDLELPATPRRSPKDEARVECAQKGDTPWPASTTKTSSD